MPDQTVPQVAGFGFGQGVTGGNAATSVTTVTTPRQLADELEAASTTAKIVEIAPGNYVFGGSGPDSVPQKITITTKNLTIRPQANAQIVLRNVALVLDLEQVDNIIIKNLRFHSDGTSTPNDAIKLEVAAPAEDATAVATTSRLRIKRCAFDGYIDIAIDGSSRLGRPRLLVTIDRCLFFDDKAGRGTFDRRGAINIAPSDGSAAIVGNSYVTVARCVFADVWRRSPRFDAGNVGHIFNNLLFRWGIGNTTNVTWRGMEVGGGSGTLPDGTALIQANRFIPWAEKPQSDPMIKIHDRTTVDLRSDQGDSKPNRFDSPSPGAPTVPADRKRHMTRAELYGPTGLTPPDVTDAATLNWRDEIIAQAGPKGSFADEIVRGVRTALLGLIDPPRRNS